MQRGNTKACRTCEITLRNTKYLEITKSNIQLPNAWEKTKVEMNLKNTY